MSKYTDLANAEAIAAEAEAVEPDADAPTEGDAEPDAAPPEPAGDAPSEAELRRFEAENTRHEKALARIMGDDFEHFEPCATCEGVGHVPAGLNKDLPFELDPAREACDRCNGYGTTYTGAKPPGQDTMACSLCQGLGWRAKPEHTGEPAPLPFTPTEPAQAEPAGNEQPAEDPRVVELREAGYIVFEGPAGVPAPGA